jgi:hypothetical protein
MQMWEGTIPLTIVLVFHAWGVGVPMGVGVLCLWSLVRAVSVVLVF